MTLNTENILPEETESIAEDYTVIIYIQEYWYYSSELEIKYHDTSKIWIFVKTPVWKTMSMPSKEV